MLDAGATSAELLRRAATLDLIGYYLASAVLAYVLWRVLRAGNPLVADLSTLAAFGCACLFVGRLLRLLEEPQEPEEPKDFGG